MAALSGQRVAILADNLGVEQVELTEPRRILTEAGAEVTFICPEPGEARAFNYMDRGETFAVDATLDDVSPEDFDLLVLPGGVANPDRLRTQARAVAFVRGFATAGKPIGVICHGPWTLIEAGVVGGRTLTCVPNLQTDVRNAGGTWIDADVHVDHGRPLLVSSRNHETVKAFAHALVENFAPA